VSRRIKTIDCGYLHPQFAAAYLLIDERPGAPARAAFVDNNTAHSVPRLLEALRAEGLAPEQVDWVIVTHVHLDHAGGTSLLMKECPLATCLAHPRAARHLIDPERLVRSARQVYGDEPFERMYGRIEPIPAARMREVQDGEEIAFGRGAPLRFLHTRGHANHHLCVWDPESSSVFTGDSFGLAYPALQRAGLFIFPSTSPTDFDYAQAVQSIDRIAATGARVAYPTHYGAVTDLAGAARQLKEHLAFSHSLESRYAAVSEPELTAALERELTAHLVETARHEGLELTDEDLALLKLDLELNAQGLAHVIRKRREPPSHV
jgi:glyoxylase-like metal-dependent hydrolase (beta-lactamase superfamily II)